MSKRLGDCVLQVRSKNAGPFWVTIDIFCASQSVFNEVRKHLSTEQLAAVMQTPEAVIKRFEIDSLHVIKFSIPRPVVQGHHSDRDMHGAQWAVLVEELILPD